MYHFKDRQPKETIQIIENFFKKHNLKIKEIKSIQSEIGTYSCSYLLIFNNQEILQTNGKGMTKILAQASGYAEMYERFCYFYYSMPKNPQIYKDIALKQNHLNQKILKPEELLEDNHTAYFLSYFLPDIKLNYLQQYINIYLNGYNYGNLYYNLNNKLEQKYKNLHLLSLMIGTNGAAAGNTLDEALLQGCCELYEREAILLFYQNKIKKYYEITLSDDIQYKFRKILKNIKNNNLIYHIYDLSYSLNIPVICLQLMNTVTHNSYLCFGASPIFDIALERCFTEIYQGFLTLKEQVQTYYQYLSSRENILIESQMHNGGKSNVYINEQLIFNCEQKQTYNNKIFISNINNYQTNYDLLNYIKALNAQNNKIFFWTDISLDSEIKSIHIIEDNLIQLTHIQSWTNIHLFSKEDQEKIFNIIKEINILYQNSINSKISLTIFETKMKQIIQLINNCLITENFSNKIEKILNYYQIFYYDDFNFQAFNQKSFYPYFMLFLILLNQEPNYNILQQNIYNIYRLIESYYIQKYSKEEINKILNWLHYTSIKLDFELQDMTSFWYIYKVLIEPLYNQYHSQKYKNFINIFGF